MQQKRQGIIYNDDDDVDDKEDNDAMGQVLKKQYEQKEKKNYNMYNENIVFLMCFFFSATMKMKNK